MAGHLTADLPQIKSTAVSALGAQGELEGYTKALLGIAQDYNVAVQGHTGNAVQDSFNTAYQKGVELNRRMQAVLQVLSGASDQYEVSNAEQARQLMNAEINGGSFQGQHIDGLAPRTSTMAGSQSLGTNAQADLNLNW